MNGADVASGQPSDPVTLAEGLNAVEIVVTAWDGVTTRTYTVAVTREAAAAAVIDIAAGGKHSLALKDDGTVWGWGQNGLGQLGDGTTTNRSTPVQVKGPGGGGFLTGVTAVSAGVEHTLALKSDGTVWAWGYNGNYQLGDGTGESRSLPAQVHGLNDTGFLTNITAIDSSFFHSVALMADGTVWTWGNNGGKLGDGTELSRSTPVQVLGSGGTGVLSGVTAVAAGRDHTVALKSDGSVWTWGKSPNGELGIGSAGPTVIQTTPVQVLGPGGEGLLADIIAIDAGRHYTEGTHTLALGRNGTIWAWGANFNYQLGDGTIADKPLPVQTLFP